MMEIQIKVPLFSISTQTKLVLFADDESKWQDKSNQSNSTIAYMLYALYFILYTCFIHTLYSAQRVLCFYCKLLDPSFYCPVVLMNFRTFYNLNSQKCGKLELGLVTLVSQQLVNFWEIAQTVAFTNVHVKHCVESIVLFSEVAKLSDTQIKSCVALSFLVVCLSHMVTSPVISTVCCFRPYKFCMV